jgi:hypothetical protein
LAPGENQSGHEKWAAVIFKLENNPKLASKNVKSGEIQDHQDHHTGKEASTLSYKVARSFSSKGRHPAINTYRITPHDQMSAADPS